MNIQNIMNKVIPLPQNMKISDGISFDKKRIGIIISQEVTPAMKTAVAILSRFTENSHFQPDFQIELSMIEKSKDSVAEKGLKNAKFKQQAYAILPVMNKKVFSGLAIKAYSDVGLLYGVRTLSQILVEEDGGIYIPKIKIFDWPDVEFRGQWGGTSDKDIPYYSQYKFNAIDFKVVLSADENGNAAVTHNDDLYATAEKYGVDVAATISHLEQISRSGFLKNKPEIESIPSEERKNRCDYYPGLCMRHPVTKEMVASWFMEIAKNSHVHKILVWLSEEESPCFCERCKGEEPFGLEVECLLEAYEKMRIQYPDVKLGIMLSQGSFKVTKKLADMLPEEVSLTYYDGGRTYDSGQYEMVLPELMEYIKRGGLLGIYPQITHSWRTVFPMRSPYFIKYRCDEFERKELHRVIGYAVPDNRYHEFNLLCMLEWLWNNKGRDEKQFTMTYALLNDYDPSLYYQYIKTLKEPSWDLAHSRMFVRLMYNYPLVLRSSIKFADHRFEMADILDIKNIDKDIKQALKAIEIAKKMNSKSLKHEASAIYGGLISYQAITGFIKEITRKSINQNKLIEYYNRTKEGSNLIYNSIMKWSEKILSEKENHHSRVSDTAIIIFRVLDGMQRYLKDTNVDLNEDEQRVIHVGEWDEGDFDDDNSALLQFDVTAAVLAKKEGIYNICLDFIDSQSGTEIKSIHLNELQPGGGEKTVARVAENLKRLSVWEPWVDYKMIINQVRKGMKYIIEIKASAMEKGEKTARGMIGIRKVK